MTNNYQQVPNQELSPSPENPYRFYCYVTMFLFGVFGLLSLFEFFTNGPVLYEPTFVVNSALVYPFDISNSRLTANWDLLIAYENSITFKSRQSYSVIFQDVQASILLNNNNVVVSSMPVRNFFIEDNNNQYEKKLYEVKLASFGVPINETVVEAVNGERRRGTLTFSFNLKCVGSVNRGGKDIFYGEAVNHVDVLCEDLKVFFVDNSTISPAGSKLEGPFPCKVRLSDY